MIRKAAILACAALCASAAFSDVHALDILFAPLFTYEGEGDRASLCAFGPLIEHTGGFFALRPVFSLDTDSETSTFLYPLGASTADSTYFVPLMRRSGDPDHSRLDVFPIFSGIYKGERYGGVFPLYGHAVHRLGHDDALFVLWPVFMKTRKNDEQTYSFLWPVFSYRQGSLLRVFPVYGREVTGETEKTFAIWPVFHHESGPRRTVYAVLPLFRYEYGPAHWNASIAWPFFTYNRDDSLAHTSFDAPWPLVRVASGAYEETRVLPLYWSRDQGESYRMRSVLWPLWYTTSSVRKDVGGVPSMETTSAVLILNRLKTSIDAAGEFSRELTVWPFVHVSWSKDTSRWFFPALIPLYGDELFLRTWGAFLTLASGERTRASSRLSVLWKTFYWEHEERRSRWWFSFLASRSTTPASDTWGVLGNIITFSHRPEEPLPKTGTGTHVP